MNEKAMDEENHSIQNIRWAQEAENFEDDQFEHHAAQREC
jgi:hypothetical protein